MKHNKKLFGFILGALTALSLTSCTLPNLPGFTPPKRPGQDENTPSMSQPNQPDVSQDTTSGNNNDNIYFTVSFDSVGGGYFDSQTVKKNAWVKYPGDPYKSGYKFLYWAYNGRQWDFYRDQCMGNMTLVAQYEYDNYSEPTIYIENLDFITSHKYKVGDFEWLKITFSDNHFFSEAIANGDLKIYSSNSSVVSVTNEDGCRLDMVGAGQCDVMVDYYSQNIRFAVFVEDNKPEDLLISISDLRNKIVNNQVQEKQKVTTFGYIRATYEQNADHLYGGMVIGSGNSSIYLYGNVNNFFSQNLSIGSLVKVQGVLKNYHGLWEIVVDPDTNADLISSVNEIVSVEVLPISGIYSYDEHNIGTLTPYEQSNFIILRDCKYLSGTVDNLTGNFSIKFMIGDKPVSFDINHHIGLNAMTYYVALTHSLKSEHPYELSGVYYEDAGIMHIKPKFTMDITPERCLYQLDKINPSTLNIVGPTRLINGQTKAYSVTSQPYGSNAAVYWSVDNESIATIDPLGNLTAISVGKVTLKATSIFDSSVYASFVVEIKPGAVANGFGPATKIDMGGCYAIGAAFNDSYQLIGRDLLMNVSSYFAADKYIVIDAGSNSFYLYNSSTSQYLNVRDITIDNIVTLDSNDKIAFKYDASSFGLVTVINGQEYVLLANNGIDHNLVVDLLSNAEGKNIVNLMDNYASPVKTGFDGDGEYVIGDKTGSGYFSVYDNHGRPYTGFYYDYQKACILKVSKVADGYTLFDAKFGGFIYPLNRSLRFRNDPYSWQFDPNLKMFTCNIDCDGDGISEICTIEKSDASMYLRITPVNNITNLENVCQLYRPALLSKTDLITCDVVGQLHVGMTKEIVTHVYPSSARQEVKIRTDDINLFNIRGNSIEAINPGTGTITVSNGDKLINVTVEVLPALEGQITDTFDFTTLPEGKISGEPCGDIVMNRVVLHTEKGTSMTDARYWQSAPMEGTPARPASIRFYKGNIVQFNQNANVKLMQVTLFGQCQFLTIENGTVVVDQETGAFDKTRNIITLTDPTKPLRIDGKCNISRIEIITAM